MQATARAYERHEPEKTLLYRVVREQFATLKELEADDEPGAGLPAFVVNEFEAFLDCGILSRGFLRLACKACRYERFVGFSCKTRTLCPSCAARRRDAVCEQLMERVWPDLPLRQWVLSPPPELVGLLGARGDVLSAMNRFFSRAIDKRLRRRARARGIEGGKSGGVTFIQRFSSTLRLFPHLHLLAFDGVFSRRDEEPPEFHALSAPPEGEIEDVAHEVATKLAKHLEKLGFVGEAHEASTSTLTSVDRWYAKVQRDRDVLVALDEQGDLEPLEPPRGETTREVDTYGFSVHAKVRVAALDRDGRRRLCKYVLRPPLAHDQLEELEDGRITLELKSPSKSGATHTVLEPLVLTRRLAWLVPQVYKHQTIYFGVLAGSSKWRKQIVPRKQPPTSPRLSLAMPAASCAEPTIAPALVPIANQNQATKHEPTLAPKTKDRSAGAPRKTTDEDAAKAKATDAEPDVEQILSEESYLCWADLLRRTYEIDALQCGRCGGRLTPVGVITNPKVAAKILEHLGIDSTTPRFAPSRGPP